MTWIELVLMAVGFAIASYSIVGNDAIQTLGTFLSSNSKRPWWVLWIFAAGIMALVMVYGWWVNDGDMSYGRLAKYPLPSPFSWYYLIPPVALLLLTRFGMPVSTTFLVLTVFQAKNLPDMLVKSLLGYVVAFAVGIVVYLMVARLVEKRFIDTHDRPPPSYWVALQWVSTSYLWAMWLIQDLANIYVYLPRRLDWSGMVGSLVVMAAIQAYIFYTRGGAIQKIVTSKTNTQDIRSATIIDFLFGSVLLLFKDGWVTWAVFGEASTLPMSTTWVFLGLLAGRELAMNLFLRLRSWRDIGGSIGGDALKATVGLVMSVLIALGLPWITSLAVAPELPTPAQVEPANSPAPPAAAPPTPEASTSATAP